MKKLLLLFCLSLAVTCNPALAQSNTAISFTPLTRVEFIDGNPEFTTPIDLKVTQLFPIGTGGFYYGLGVGFGINTNIGNDRKLRGEVPVMAILGGDLFNWAAISIGAGLNAANGNPIIGVGINAYTFPIGGGATQRNARPEDVPAIIHNSDYKRNIKGYKN